MKSFEFQIVILIVDICPATVREHSERLPVARIPLYPARTFQNTNASFADSTGSQSLTSLRSGYVRDIFNFHVGTSDSSTCRAGQQRCVESESCIEDRAGRRADKRRATSGSIRTSRRVVYNRACLSRRL